MENIEEIIKKLPEKWEETAKETKAFVRAREIKTAMDFMQLIFMYIVHGLSLLEVAAIAKLKGMAKISDVAFMKRFGNCNEFFKEILKKLKPLATANYKKPKFLEKYRVKLADVSAVVKGGKGKKTYHLHYAINPFEMKSEQYKITAESVGESLTNFDVLAGDLYICDRAYGTKTSMKYCMAAGGDFIFRLKKGAFDIYGKKGNKVNIADKLRKLKEGKYLDWNCYFKDGKEFVPIRICAMKKPKNVKELDETSTDTELMNNYIVVVTSLLKKKKISASQVLDAYRIRWQVELYFKRLKSLLGFGEIPAKTNEHIETWLNAKLVSAILLEIEAGSVDFSPSG